MRNCFGQNENYTKSICLNLPSASFLREYLSTKITNDVVVLSKQRSSFKISYCQCYSLEGINYQCKVSSRFRHFFQFSVPNYKLLEQYADLAIYF